MLKRWMPIATAVGVGLFALVTVRAQSKGTAAPTLTPLDYIQIQQLVVRYPYAVDTAADNGEMYAGLFAPDGVFVQRGGDVRGKEALAATARRFQRGPKSAFHFLMDHVISPSPEGAIGKEHLAQFIFGDNGQPSRIFGGGHYDDVYEKTADGWRFKSRQFIPSQNGLEVTTPTAPFLPLQKIAISSSKNGTLTASDYLEIQQLIARYPFALDTGTDHGNMYANLYTPDGTFGKLKGRDALLGLAWQHRPGQGPLYTRNFSSNVLIRPSPEGATGRISAAVLDIGEGTGKPSTVLNGSRYEDTYVRTPDGWRIKSRQVVASKGGEQTTDLPPMQVPVKVAKDSGRQPKANKDSKAPALAVEDYVEIQQIVAAYPVALDTGADTGYVFADLFASDGAFVVGAKKFEGREALKKFAWHHRPGQGPLYTRNLSTAAMIEPATEGATGRINAVVFDFGEGGKPSSVLEGGHYEDVYVKTPAGWRIKRREFFYSKTELPPRPQPVAANR